MPQFRSLFAILFLALLSAVKAAPAVQSTEPIATALRRDVESSEDLERRPGRCHETQIRREWCVQLALVPQKSLK